MDLSRFTSNGKFLMLALDHRGSFKKLMNPQDPEAVKDEEVIVLKSEIIEALKDQFSGLLIDEIWGLEACREVCQTKPFLLPLEKSGYKELDGERVTELEFTVQQLMHNKASGAKLLVYFNPEAQTTDKQLDMAKKVLGECSRYNFPLFLEIVTYGLSAHPGGVVGRHLGRVVDSVRMFLENKVVPDVFKLEYPGSFEACGDITKLLGNTPWILLTGGDDFDIFKVHLGDAIKAGAKGFLAGRALWQELTTLAGEEKEKFLQETLPERFRALAKIAASV